MRDFRQIKVWSKAHQLTLEIYKATAVLPVEERYGLTSQLRRSAVSVASNIAEGFGRGGNAELARFLQIGMGSAAEVEYQILLAHDLKLISPQVYADLQTQVVEVKKMLAALIMRVRFDRDPRVINSADC
ncbi:MAG TPA: four helix bundle protein [Pyrinomonadaceae bacterium]